MKGRGNGKKGKGIREKEKGEEVRGSVVESKKILKIDPE